MVRQRYNFCSRAHRSSVSTLISQVLRHGGRQVRHSESSLLMQMRVILSDQQRAHFKINRAERSRSSSSWTDLSIESAESSGKKQSAPSDGGSLEPNYIGQLRAVPSASTGLPALQLGRGVQLCHRQPVQCVRPSRSAQSSLRLLRLPAPPPPAKPARDLPTPATYASALRVGFLWPGRQLNQSFRSSFGRHYNRRRHRSSPVVDSLSRYTHGCRVTAGNPGQHHRVAGTRLREGCFLRISSGYSRRAACSCAD